MSLHFLAKKGIMVVKDVEREDVDFICKTVGCKPVSHVDYLTEDKLGKAQLAQEVPIDDTKKILEITGVHSKETISILLRGSNGLVVDEAERSLHDALCVVRSLVKLKYYNIAYVCHNKYYILI